MFSNTYANFRPVFLPIARGHVFCDSIGVGSSDCTQFEYRKLRRPIYSKTTNYGHFGKTDRDLTWEATNKVSALLAAL